MPTRIALTSSPSATTMTKSERSIKHELSESEDDKEKQRAARTEYSELAKAESLGLTSEDVNGWMEMHRASLSRAIEN